MITYNKNALSDRVMNSIVTIDKPNPESQAYNIALSKIEKCYRTKDKKLNLSGLGLVKIPPEIAKLKHLNGLVIYNNNLNSLPPEIGELFELSEIIAYNNKITIVPNVVKKLNKLRWLDLMDNNITYLPIWLGKLNNLQHIFLHGNKKLNLSPSILGSDPRKSARHDNIVTAKSILDYYFIRRTETTRPLNEVKLILVGRGGAGKTSTVHALLNKPHNEEQDSTPGIALCDWEMEKCKNEPVTAHIWDFAGQVITHALHQFFFSVRSVYLLVLTGRENNEREDAEYWLRLIKSFGTDSAGVGPPVVIALNKWDVPGCRPKIDRSVLKERYPFIRGFVEMDCKTRRGIASLKTLLCREVSKMKWVREPINNRWDAVRRNLASGRKKRPHLTYSQYRDLCEKNGVVDSGEQDSLSEILHNLGAALNYRTDPRLREATVLQPEWLTRNVYALMRRAEKQVGVLSLSDVNEVLKKEKDLDMRRYLIQLMERFEITYASKAQSEVWLVPQALPDQQPQEALIFRDATDATRLRYTYPALPEGLVSRAVVRLHEFIRESNNKKLQWASGAILMRGDAQALIRTEPQDRQVMITILGPKKARQQLAGLCQAEMRDIHAEIQGLDPQEETFYANAWVATTTLELDEKQGRKTGIATKDRGTISVDPSEPNNDYSEKPSRLDKIWKPSVFISYSKNNIIQRRRLESELKILKNEGLLERNWHDRMIDPGDKWNEAIQNQLSEADVIIVLASSSALSTDYITLHEIPRALDLHNNGKTVVIPIVLERCRWANTALGDLNALPEKARPLNNWRPQSDGWNSIAEGLAVAFRKLIENKGTTKVRRSALV